MANSYDLTVIGAGGSGLTAAARAAELGVRRILVLEKNKTPGGNSVFPRGVICLNSSQQLKQGRAGNIASIVANAMARMKWAANPYIVRRYLETTGALADWILGFFPYPLKIEEKSPPGELTMGTLEPEKDTNERMGHTLTETLAKKCAGLGVEFLTEACVKRLERESAGFRITWIKDAVAFTTYSKKVLISAGGVAGSVKALSKYFPGLYSPTEPRSSNSIPSCVGEGIELAASVGAETGKGMSIFIGGPVCHPNYFVSSAIMNPKCLWLNAHGRRFTDETLGYSATQALMTQPEKILWAVFDSRCLEKIRDELCEDPRFAMRGFNAQDMEKEFRKLAEGKRYAIVANSLEEMADFAKIDRKIFIESIERYNNMCAAKIDSDMFKRAENLEPLAIPPFYMAFANHFHDSTQGGITIDERMRVLDTSGNPVEGLYASGDNAGGFVSPYGYAPMGAGFTWALCSGYLAASSIAESIV